FGTLSSPCVFPLAPPFYSSLHTTADIFGKPNRRVTYNRARAMLGLLTLTILVIGALMAAMAVGVIFKNKSLRGSCGGPDIVDCDGESLACGTCPNRAEK